MSKKNKEVLEIRPRMGVEIMEAYHLLNDRSEEFFARFEITPQQFNVLAILHYTGPVSTSVILEWMFEKNAGVSRLVDRLVKKGLVVKKANPGDNRLIEVDLTSKGEEMYQLISPQIKEIDGVSENLTDQEVRQLIQLLVKLKGY